LREEKRTIFKTSPLDKGMKIAYICPFWDPAICGVKQVVKELAKKMQQKGYEVHVFASDWDKTKRIKEKEEKEEGVYIHRCFHILRAVNFVTIWPSIFLRILMQDIDIVHTHLAAHPHVYLAALAARIKGIPHIHTTHCPWSDAPRSRIGNLLLEPNYKIFNKLVFKTANKIIAITPWEEKYIRKYGGKEIRIIPNGMDDIFYTKIKKKKFREKYGIPKNKTLILFFGRLSSTKTPEFLAKIGKEMLQERKDIVFVFVGPDEGNKKIVENIIKGEKEMFLLDPIRNRKEIVDMYQSADIYALPSYREGLPLTIFEAMASGLPIIATPVNGIPYEIKDKINGFLREWGNKEEWKKALTEMIDNKKLRKKIAKNNRNMAKSYRWDLIAKRTEEIYKEALRE